MRRFLRSCRAEYRHIGTLTYPAAFPLDGRAVKDHLRRLLQELRRHLERRYASVGCADYSTFWFLEFQSRGAPHVHFFTTHFFDRAWLAGTWYRIVGSDDDRHLRAGTQLDELRGGRGAAASYAAKYAVKMDQKTVPDEFQSVGRFWGVSGLRECVAAATRVILDEARYPRTWDAYLSLRRELLSLKKAGEAFVHVKNGMSLGMIVRGIDSQIKVAKAVRGLAFVFAAESGRGALCVPLGGMDMDAEGFSVA